MKKPNEYLLSDLSVGQTESFTVNITEKMQDTFRELTGDINPMHTDTDFAHAGGYRDRLVYGMLTASFLSTLVGVYLPGKHCLFHECDIQWPRPVYIGDTLVITGKVEDVSETLNMVTIKAVIKNQDNVKVARAKLMAEVKTRG